MQKKAIAIVIAAAIALPLAAQARTEVSVCGNLDTQLNDVHVYGAAASGTPVGSPVLTAARQGRNSPWAPTTTSNEI